VLLSLSKTAGGLSRPVPMFTRRLAPGIAIADNPPGGESFGVSRMRLVAEGLADAWRNGPASPTARLRAVTKRFRSAGLDLRRPWLNPGNVEIVLPPAARGRMLTQVKQSRWLDVADRIGQQLVRDAVWDRDQCTWMSWFVVPSGESHKVAFCTAGGDLYSGSAGISLFLARLARLTGNERVKAAALGAIRHAIDRTKRGGRIGAYAGLTGVLYSALSVAEALASDEVAAAVPSLWRRITKLRPDASELDIVEGRAGAIRVLLHASQLGLAGALALATQLGNEVLELAIRHGGCLSWETLSSPVVQPLLGYSHGTTGIAAALYQLSQVTGDARYLQGAQGALRYDAAAFDPARKNWPDFRKLSWEYPDEKEEGRFMVGWCNGAPGIALTLARLSPAHREEAHLDAAIETTLASLPPYAPPRNGDFCLCHGVAGNAEILLQIHELTKRTNLVPAVHAAAEEGLRRYHRFGTWPCGISDAGESAGLLVGLAGIGYFYLRLHDPSIESPLVL
jgi:lantibiotic modifying enzyme